MSTYNIINGKMRKLVFKSTQLSGGLSALIVKPVLRDHSKIDKTKVLKTNSSLIKVKSIAECSKRANFDLH